MGLSLRESRAAAEMARVLCTFLPGSADPRWKGHVSFPTVAREAGVGEFWHTGSKEPAIAGLLERTLERRRERFEDLVVGIVRAGLKYRQKGDKPITPGEIQMLNGLILEIGFKFPDLWDPAFLASLGSPGAVRAMGLVERERAAESLAAATRCAESARLEQLRVRFYELSAQTNRQAAGHALEEILNELFVLRGLAPRKRFRVTGEEIDGSFVLDAEVYLVEAKWEARPLAEAPLLVFRAKVSGKSQFTRGVFISVNGYSADAIAAITHGKQPNFFLMDGYDLAVVLEGQIALDDLLRRKLRSLADDGHVYVSAREIIGKPGG
jgi:hypothetical protein